MIFNKLTTKSYHFKNPAISLSIKSGRIRLNMECARLLNIKEKSTIHFYKDNECNWYIGNGDSIGFDLRMEKNCYVANAKDFIQIVYKENNISLKISTIAISVFETPSYFNKNENPWYGLNISIFKR